MSLYGKGMTEMLSNSVFHNRQYQRTARCIHDGAFLATPIGRHSGIGLVPVGYLVSGWVGRDIVNATIQVERTITTNTGREGHDRDNLRRC